MFRWFAAGMLAVLLCADVRADSISYSDSVTISPTNWEDTVTVSQFDPALGSLTSIIFELNGIVNGTFRFESLDSAPATITGVLEAMLTLYRPDQSVLLSVSPSASTSDKVTAYDNSVDFAGTSGRTYNDLVGQSANQTTITPLGNDLALFSGTGSVVLPISASGFSTASGAGNLIAGFTTQAGADLRVTYEYDPVPVVEQPEPMSLAMLGIGALAVIPVVRRRRKKTTEVAI